MVCAKCGGSRKLPFYRPDGTISPHVLVDCECYVELEPVLPGGPEDFDYPMSAVYRRHSFAATEAHDPAFNPNGADIRDLGERLVLLESRAQVDEAQQVKLLRLQVKRLTQKMETMGARPTAKSTTAIATQKSAYRGLRNA